MVSIGLTMLGRIHCTEAVSTNIYTERGREREREKSQIYIKIRPWFVSSLSWKKSGERWNVIR